MVGRSIWSITDSPIKMKNGRPAVVKMKGVPIVRFKTINDTPKKKKNGSS
jgi:hypothetical protein